MKIINRIKAGAKVAPAFILVLYYLFVALDLFTSYLAAPDMRYEGNRIVRFFDLNWSQFVIFYSLIILFVTLGLLVALDFLHVYFQDNNIINNHSLIIEVIRNKKILISFIMLGCFYSHVINLGHIIINNYLGYIYIYKVENSLSKISNCYISEQSFFLLYIKTIPILIGYIVAAFKVKSIRNKYRALSVEK